jgi:hypothetical protein
MSISARAREAGYASLVFLFALFLCSALAWVGSPCRFGAVAGEA